MLEMLLMIVILLGVPLGYASAYNSIAEAAAAVARDKTSSRGVVARSYKETSLLVAEAYQLSQISLRPAPTRRLLERSANVGGLDYDARRRRLYWSDMSTGRIHAAGLDSLPLGFANTTFLELSPREWRPRALAVDFVGDKLYVLDSRGKRLHVVDLESRRRCVLLERGELREPTDLALDPARALAFVADGTRILRLNMDGSEPRAIVSHPRYRIRALALDPSGQRLFWSDAAFHRVKTADYGGARARVLLKNERGHHQDLLGPAQLAYHDGRLYFYDDVYRSISVLDVANPDGGARLIYDRLSVRAIRVLNSAGQPKLEGNPCADNHGCGHMCLIARRRGSELEAKCACDVGARLDEDAKSCVTLTR